VCLFYILMTSSGSLCHSYYLSDSWNILLYVMLCYVPCTAHAVLLYLICLTISGDEYRLWSSQPCNFVYCCVTSSLLGSNSALSTLFSNTLSLPLMLETSQSVPDVASHRQSDHTTYCVWCLAWKFSGRSHVHMETGGVQAALLTQQCYTSSTVHRG
jgi:hypothetical protein